MEHTAGNRRLTRRLGAVVVTATLLAAACGSSSSTSPPPAGAGDADESAQQTPPCVLPPDTRVVDLTFDELRRYELNNGAPIPTLEEYLDLADAAGVGVLPEIKTFPPPGSDQSEPPSDAQLADYARMVAERSGIPQVLIGSFSEPVLAYFAANRPQWPRVWFRSLSPTGPLSPPTVAEMRERAPSATALGVLNILYSQGTSPLDGQTYDVPAEFAAAGIPVYLWFNVLTGGDAADGGAGTLGDVVSPGWAALVDLSPANIVWMATDNTADYAAWSASLPPDGPTAPEMVAHRGGGSESVSENSLDAFRQAVADGATVLETDVQWTRPTADAPNGVPVLMHDATINRTMRCPG